ncbi:MAG: hypothetical protein ACXU86_07430 [Archangium sp.]
MTTALHTYTLLAQAGAGHIQGGWGYILTAYGIAWTSLSLYALSLWLRRPGKAANDSKE